VPRDERPVEDQCGGQAILLYVNEDQFKPSVHGTNTCVACHRDLNSVKEHPDDRHVVEPVNCSACHTNEGTQYAGSIHGFNHQKGGFAAACADCHGKHDMAPVKNLDSPVFKLNLPRRPVRLSQRRRSTSGTASSLPDAASQYLDASTGVVS
jgi:hypothetical protein